MPTILESEIRFLVQKRSIVELGYKTNDHS